MDTSPRTSTENVTWRAILIGLLSLPLNIYLVVQTETVWTTQYPTTMAIIFNAVFTLFLVAIINLPLSRYLPKWQLTQAEMLTIYLMVTLACVVCGHDLLQATMCVLGHATWFATPENEWQSLFFSIYSRLDCCHESTCFNRLLRRHFKLI